jgi:hypothetical protein
MKLRILAFALCAFGIFDVAQAITVTVYITTPPQQTTNETMKAGMKVKGNTMWYALSTAGGFTITCEYNSMPISVQTGTYTQNFLPRTEPLELIVWVPYTLVGTYGTAGWSTFSSGCRKCNFAYTGTAADGQLSYSGAGVNVSFPSSGDSKGNVITFDMCKGTSQCN